MPRGVEVRVFLAAPNCRFDRKGDLKSPPIGFPQWRPFLCRGSSPFHQAEDIAVRILEPGGFHALSDIEVALTLEAGAPDNVTGIAIWASDPTLISFTQPGQ